MKTEKGGVKVKTDARDAKNIAECLAFNTYKAVYIPSQEDEAVRDYIRMVDDLKGLKKKIQQQVNGLLLRHHYVYAKTKWTQSHLDWIQKLDLSPLDKETLNEYLSTYHAMCDKIERFTKRIVELSQGQRYQEIINRLICFLGITRERERAICSEVGDFKRFAHPRSFTSFCGLTPTEKSSGETKRKGGITKTGNNHIRKELIEAAQSICRGKIGYKSKALKKRQENQSSTVIEYADKGNDA